MFHFSLISEIFKSFDNPNNNRLTSISVNNWLIYCAFCLHSDSHSQNKCHVLSPAKRKQGKKSIISEIFFFSLKCMCLDKTGETIKLMIFLVLTPLSKNTLQKHYFYFSKRIDSACNATNDTDEAIFIKKAVYCRSTKVKWILSFFVIKIVKRVVDKLLYISSLCNGYFSKIYISPRTLS